MKKMRIWGVEFWSSMNFLSCKKCTNLGWGFEGSDFSGHISYCPYFTLFHISMGRDPKMYDLGELGVSWDLRLLQ